MYLCGDKGEQIFKNAHLSEDDAKKFERVTKVFEDYYRPRRNILYHRAMFLRRMQASDESVENFIADCYRIAAHCDYGDESDNMLRDRIASGLANAKLRDDLIFSERALNLEQVLAKVRSTEQVKKESQQLNAEKSDVAAVRGTRPKQRRERGHRDKSKMDTRNLSAPATAAVTHLTENTNVPHSTKHVASVIGGDITQKCVEQKTRKTFAQWRIKKSLFLWEK